ncbi:recombinase family protein [Stutzerimonas frequens]|uniref:recombinase family protein n=1 Tax=Stutzerimonas frequens TaxID=2968969 RepID=UPI003C2B32A2
MPTAFSYVRFSSAKQARGSSLERQQAMVAQWLASHPDYTLSLTSFEDLGRSGWKGEHLENGFGKLLAAVEAGVIQPGDCILVEAIDRTGRLEPLEMLPLLGRIVQAGVMIVTLDDGLTYDQKSANSNHLFLLVAKVQQAYNYSEALSRRINAAYDRRRRAAKEGKAVKRHTPMWIDKEGKLIESVAPLVRQAFEDYAAGLGERRICRRLRESGHELLQTINGTTVKRWLTNTTAIGNWGEIPNVYEPVVPKELFYRVQEQLSRNKDQKRSAPTAYLLTGLVKCGHCGRNFNVKKHPNTGATMQCTSRARLTLDGCSNSKSIPKQLLEHIRVKTSLPYVERALAGQLLTEHQKRKIEIEGELEDLSKRIGNLAGTIAAIGLVPEIQEQLEQLQAQRKQLQDERLILDRSADDAVSTNTIINVERDYLANDPIKLNALLQQAEYSITCFSNGEIWVSGDEHPWKYKGYDRSAKSYVYEDLGQEYRLLMLRPEQQELLDRVNKQPLPEPTPEFNDLLSLIARGHRRRADDA